MENPSIGFYSYLSSSLVFALLIVVYFISLQKFRHGKLFLLLIIVTLVWSMFITLSQMGELISFNFIVTADFLRYFTWFYILQRVSGFYSEKSINKHLNYMLSPKIIYLIFSVAIITLALEDPILAHLNIRHPNLIAIGWLLIFSILGLSLIEHLYRNTTREKRFQIIFLCISSGAIFSYDLFVFSDALLLKTIDYEFWSARGFVNVLIVPTLILAAVRNPSLAPTLHVSRKFVFHTTSLVGSGLYLILMSFAGYYIKEQNAEWGELLQATFLLAALLFLVVLFLSPTLKTKIKRYLNQSFSYKYDYRDEWNRFSKTLLTHDPEQSIFKRSLKSIGQIVDSQGATLWLKEHHHYRFHTGWNASPDRHEHIPEDDNFIQFIKSTKNPFTLNEYKSQNKLSTGDYWVTQSQNCWIIVPLWSGENLFGFIHLKESIAPMVLDLEDHDLLNTVAHHISLSLSLNETLSALQQSERFKQINQMTAFLVHDLKTLLSQLTLLVENGKIHRQNPDFVDDMMTTLEHVTKKMQRIILRLKNPEAKDDTLFCGITMIIQSIVDEYGSHPVKILFDNQLEEEVFITAREEELSSSIKHIIQNAYEAVDKNGKITILLKQEEKRIIIKITDNGHGMSDEFISERLFKPFDSTKGVSGMGIGMYQSREYILSINGDITVLSQEGKGTTFTIELPQKYG